MRVETWDRARVSQRLTLARPKAALRYARAGLKVLPLYEGNYRTPCACGRSDCHSPGKHPRTKHGVREATNDLKVVEQWWRQWPEANIGIATGHKVCVLDVDFDKGGYQSLEWMQSVYGELPPTWVCSTGGGGRHYFFQMPDEDVKNAVKMWKRPGLDFRGTGGYVVAGGSETPKGPYQWMYEEWTMITHSAPWQVPLAKLPGYLLNELRHSVKVKRMPRPQAKKQDVSIEAFDVIPDGERNEGLARICGSFIRAGKDEIECGTLLHSANTMLCQPPLSEREVDAICASIWRCERRNG